MHDDAPADPDVDQVAAAARNTGLFIGRFWSALKTYGVPDEVAGPITVGYAAFLFGDCPLGATWEHE